MFDNSYNVHKIRRDISFLINLLLIDGFQTSAFVIFEKK